MPWLSIHFYPHDNQDVFLTRALRPFLQQHIWATRGTRAFFVRYQDARGPHIRLRFGGDAEWLNETLRQAFQEWQEGRGDWEEMPYEPETARFGGEEALAWAEEYFHLSSRVTLERLSRDQYTYGDAMFDALRMQAIAAYAAGLSKVQAARYFGHLTEQWLPLFFAPEDSPGDAAFFKEIKEGFAQNLATQRDILRSVLTNLWKALEKENFDKKQPEWARWALGNQMILKALGENLERALPSLIHLSNNRLGLNNQDEVYLNFILAETLRD